MTDNNKQPDWKLLPADPRGFFALPAEYDRKDLKRAYSRLLRMFKPERHPAEFQRIRAAYEQLDLQMRYGTSASPEAPQSEAYQWADQWADNTAPHQRAARETSPSKGEKQRPLALHERLEKESPKDLYRELAARTQKDPYDYFGLALLSDIVDRKDPLQFPRWLLRGLKAHPSDAGLLQLMRDYLRDVEVTPALSKLLVACSQAVPNDSFYPLTEAAWENLLRQEPFESCLATLKKCQANLRDIGIAGQVVFTIRVLRFALWRDKTDWKEHALDLVEENFEQIPPHLEFEIDLLAAAHQYLATRDQFLNGDPVRQQIDKAMQSYFTLDQVEGDQAVLQCQIALLEDNERLFHAFSPDTREECDAMVAIWEWMSADVRGRLGAEDETEFDVELWYGRVTKLLKQCLSMSKGGIGGRRWQFLRVFVGSYAVLTNILLSPILGCLVGFLVMMFFYPDGGGPVFFWVTTCTLGAGIAACISVLAHAWLKERYWDPRVNRQIKNSYQNYWRPELRDFLDRSQLPFGFVTQLLEHAAEQGTGKDICELAQRDYGLALFAIAKGFVV